MPVQSIECQLVRAQIGRYLGGEPLSAEAMRQLEVHLVACDDCKEALSSRKSELRAKMSLEGAEPAKRAAKDLGPNPQRAVVDYKAIEEASRSAAAAAPAAGKLKSLRPGNFTKPLMLTAVLAGVLIAMSRMSSGSGSLFGPKAFGALFPDAAAAGAKATPASTNSTSTAQTAPPATVSSATGTASPATPATGTATSSSPVAAPTGGSATPVTKPTTSSSPSTPPQTPPSIPSGVGSAAPSADSTLRSEAAPSSTSATPISNSSTSPARTAQAIGSAHTLSSAATPGEKTDASDSGQPARQNSSPAATEVTPKPAAPAARVAPTRVAPLASHVKHVAHKIRSLRRKAAARHKPTHKPKRRATSKVRVYDASGAPIHP